MDLSTYDDLVHDVIQLYEGVDSTVEANNNPRASFVGCLLRQAGHDFMDYRPGHEHEGGSDGCMSFDDPDNKGIPSCVRKFGIHDLYGKWSNKVSLADFMVIIAEAAIGRSATDNYSRTYQKGNYFREGTYAKTLRDSFKFGRKTVEECSWNVGRMPNPEHSCEGKGPGKDGLRQIFLDNIYKADPNNGWMLLAAISGAHTIGSAKPENSGYNGFWSDSKNSGIFNNDYYKSLIFKGWGPERAVGGNAEKNQWKIVDKTRFAEHKEIMLTSDMCLAYKNNRKLLDC